MPHVIDTDDLEMLIAAYQKQREELLGQVKAIDKKVAKLRESQRSADREDSENGNNVIHILPGSYNRSGTWNDKIRFILGANAKPMTTGEILAEMLRQEPERLVERTKLRTCISATLSVGVRGKKYKRKGNVGDDFEYSIAN